MKVGITKITSGWITILQQIGVSFEEILSIENIKKDDYAVIIISSGPLKVKECKILNDFVIEGGAVLTEAKSAKKVFNVDYKYSYLKFLHSGSNELFNNYLICDLYKLTKIAKDANHLDDQDKEKTVLALKKGKGDIIVFPEGFVSLLNNSRTIRKNFYSPFSEQFTSERVSIVSKGVIRIHIQKALEYLYHRRNLPFVHLWFFPGYARSIFSFRVDTDMGTQEEIQSLYNLLRNFKIPATWFVETMSSQSWIKLYSGFNDQEIAYHCYRHKNFLSFKKNLEDVSTGLKVLENEEIKPKGYAAPYGKWNKTIGMVIDKFNFSYSSEFDFAYDTLPLYPYYNSSFSKALQIPIHPVSMGRLHWGGHSEENMIKYFFNIIDQKLFFDEPIILYTHPFEKRLNVFGKVFEYIRNINSQDDVNDFRSIPFLTFSEYALWWKKRLNIHWSAEEKNGKVFISADNGSDSIKWRAIYPDGRKDILSLNEDKHKIDEEDNPFRQIEIHNSYNPIKLRKKTFQMFKYDIIGVLRKLKL